MSTATAVKGRIKNVSVSRKKGVKKTNVEQVRMMVDYGIERDAHAGK